jgi:hypothetical protein
MCVRMRASLLVLLCVACGRATLIPPPNGGGTATGGSSAGGSAAGGGSSTGGGSGLGGGTAGGSAAGGGASLGGGSASGGGSGQSCDGLDEDTCLATSGCVVDSCFTCSCSPTYLGCRSPGEKAHECPPVGCASPVCCHDQPECGAQFGFICLAPGGTLGCPICMMGGGTCNADTDCGGGQICQPIACACDGSKQCVPGCTSDCPQGEACDNSDHPRCVPQGCNAANPCPRAFDCVMSACARRPCQTDADCGAALYCVDGSCYDSLGQCTVQPE